MRKYEIYKNSNMKEGFLPPKFDSYTFKPKNNFKYDGISVSEVEMIDPEMVSNIIKRKTKIRIDSYLYYLMELLSDDSSSDSDMDLFIDEIKRYRAIILNKYSKYLDKEYIMDLLLKTKYAEDEIERKMNMDRIKKRGRHY